MKVASWVYCVLVFDSSGKPAARPGEVPSGVPGGPGTEFEVGRATCEEEAFGATTSATMENPSIL